MAGVYLSSEEQAALYGAPWLVRELYVFGIRPVMDFNTGMVGVGSKVSWHGLARELRVESAPGIKEVLPSKSQVRRAGDHLVRRGLVTVHSDGDRLVFKCVMARLNGRAQIKADTKPTQLPGTDSGSVDVPQCVVSSGVAGNSLDKPDSIADTAKNANPTHIRESENSLSSPGGIEKFSMHSGWRVEDDKRLQAVLLIRGFDVRRLEDIEKGQILDEFTAYWSSMPERQNSQAVWESKFCDSVEHSMRRSA